MEPTFIHLHNHSEYSILDGCLKIDDLVDAAYENNMPAVAITDHGNIFGAVQFFKAAKAKGVKPILGCEVYVAPRSRFDKKPSAARRRPPLPPHPPRQGRPRLQEPLQARHPELSRGLLLPAADRQGAPGRPHRGPHRALEPASRARSPSCSAAGSPRRPRRPPGRTPRSSRPAISTSSSRTTASPEQKAVNPQLVGLARKLGLPLVATNDIHFARREDAESQDVLVCIQTNRKISDPDRLRFSDRPVLFQVRGRDGRALPRRRPRPSRTRARSPPAATSISRPRRYYLPQLRAARAARPSSEYFEEVAWEGFRARMARRQAEGAERRRLATP